MSRPPTREISDLDGVRGPWGVEISDLAGGRA